MKFDLPTTPLFDNWYEYRPGQKNETRVAIVRLAVFHSDSMYNAKNWGSW